MTLADHYAGEECPSCGGEVRRWMSKIVEDLRFELATEAMELVL